MSKKPKDNIILTIVILVLYTCFVLLIFIIPPPPPPPPNRSPELSIKEVRGAVKNGDRYVIRKKQELEITLSANDEDGDKLSFYVENKPATADFSDKVFQWKPAKASDSTTVTFGVTDGKGGVDSEKITIDVINQSPKLSFKVEGAEYVANENKYVAKKNKELKITLSGTDEDGDDLSYNIENLPENSTFSEKEFVWIPTKASNSTTPFTFRVTDGDEGGVDSEEVKIEVINQPPKLAEIGDKTVRVGEPLSFVVSAKDPDGDTLTYSFSSEPDIQLLGAGIHSTTGSFSWQPQREHIGKYEVTFTVDDGDINGKDSKTITIIVEDTSPVPPRTQVRVKFNVRPPAKSIFIGESLLTNEEMEHGALRDRGTYLIRMKRGNNERFEDNYRINQEMTITVTSKDWNIRVNINCRPEAKKILLDDGRSPGKVIKEDLSSGTVDLKVGTYTFEFQLKNGSSPKENIRVDTNLKGIVVRGSHISKEYYENQH